MPVALIDHMGGDLRVVNAARVSYGKSSDYVWHCKNCLTYNTHFSCTGCNLGDKALEMTLKPADVGLINYLMRERHGTPFEMVVFTFHVECPIGVAREWQRHRIGSFNEVSTRYVEMPEHAYIPEGEAWRTQTGKPGHYEMQPLNERDTDLSAALIQQAYSNAYDAYKALLERGVAKELARNVLPLGQYTEFYWTVNLRSLFNFLSLRTHKTALYEIRLEAKQVLELAQPVAPVCFNAWEANNRVSP